MSCSATFLRRKLRVEVSPQAALRFFMLDVHRPDDNLLKCCALMNYAVYNALNAFRASSTIRTAEVSADALGQALLNAVMGHPASEEFFRKRWADGFIRGPPHPDD